MSDALTTAPIRKSDYKRVQERAKKTGQKLYAVIGDAVESLANPQRTKTKKETAV